MAESTLIKKLAKVMSDVKYIQKRGKNKFHGYMYATEADVNEKVREELAKANILMLPSVKATEIRETKTLKGNTEYIARVDMEFVFVDGDSGEERTILMSGEGQDNGDKAIYKAISGTQKYALMKCFMIPTGDDPEEDRESEGNGSKPTPSPSPPDPATRTTVASTPNISGYVITEEDVPEPPPRRQPTKTNFACSDCSKGITEKVHKFSTDKMGKALCMDCQKKNG